MATARTLMLTTIALLGIAVPSARADMFQIDDGRVAGSTLFWNWTGTNPIPAGALGGVGVTQAELDFHSSVPDLVVRPGEVFTLAPALTGTFSGFTNLDGRDGDIAGEGDLRFVLSSLTAPAEFPGSTDSLGLITFTRSFSMSGFVSGSVREFFSAPEGETGVRTLGSFRDDLYGHGTVTIAFQARPDTRDYALAGWGFVFEPSAAVPEPSTLLLLGPFALHGIVGRARRWRRSTTRTFHSL